MPNKRGDNQYINPANATRVTGAVLNTNAKELKRKANVLKKFSDQVKAAPKDNRSPTKKIWDTVDRTVIGTVGGFVGMNLLSSIPGKFEKKPIYETYKPIPAQQLIKEYKTRTEIVKEASKAGFDVKYVKPDPGRYYSNDAPRELDGDAVILSELDKRKKEAAKIKPWGKADDALVKKLDSKLDLTKKTFSKDELKLATRIDDTMYKENVERLAKMSKKEAAALIQKQAKTTKTVVDYATKYKPLLSKASRLGWGAIGAVVGGTVGFMEDRKEENANGYVTPGEVKALKQMTTDLRSSTAQLRTQTATLRAQQLKTSPPHKTLISLVNPTAATQAKSMSSTEIASIRRDAGPKTVTDRALKPIKR